MIIWNQTFEVGIPVIDADHRKLIDGLNRLEETILTGQSCDQIEAVLEFLRRYADEHFLREEFCMHRLKCPKAAANRSAHGHFRQMYVQMKEKARQVQIRDRVAQQVHAELVAWFTQHILQIDGSLKTCAKPDARLSLHPGSPA